MDSLSMKTVWIMMLATYSVCSFLVMLLWMQNRRRYGGTHLWAVGFVCQTLGVFLIIMRGLIPDFLSIVAGNASILCGAALIFIGLEVFLGREGSYRSCAVLMVPWLFVQIWGTYIHPSITLRSVNSTAGLIIVFVFCLRLLLFKTGPETRMLAREVVLAFAGYCALSLVRLAHLLSTGIRTHDFFRAGAFEIFIFVCYSLFFIMLTHSFAFMVNKRLMKEVNAEKDKFAKAFHSAPFGMVIKRMSDGLILEINQEYGKTTGYAAAEMVGRTVPSMHIWERDEDRRAMIEELITNGRVHGIEAVLRTKDGSKITGLYSAEIISIDGEEAILSTINDITERKRMEERIRDISTRDPLTNIYNRRYILERLEVIMKEYERVGRPFTLAMIDLDHFKSVNDTFGHGAGDMVLIDFTRIVAANIRPYDLFGRYGGEEFLVIFVSTAKPHAETITARILELVQNRKVDAAGTSLRYAFSCGLADSSEFGSGALSIERMIGMIDRRLYEAKRTGRSRIVSEG